MTTTPHTPTLRFTQDDGTPYPDWEEKTLGEEGQFYGGLSGKNKTDFENGNTPFLTYMNVYKNTFADPTQKGLVTLKEGEKQQRVQYADILFTQSSETVEEVGLSSVYLHNDEPCLNSFCMGFRLNSLDNVDPRFMGYLMRTEQVRTHMMLMGQGISRINISSTRLATVKYKLPSLTEQRKIADLLTSIDTVISTQEAEITAWQHRKKGVMQQLFTQQTRFTQDDGTNYPDWEEKTVGDLFEFTTEKNSGRTINNVLTNSAQLGIIPQREYFDKNIAVEENTDSYTIVRTGTFVYNPRKSIYAPYGPFNRYTGDEPGIVSPLYTCLTIKNPDYSGYLSWYFKTNCWHHYILTNGAQSGARHDRVGMTNTLMKGIPVLLPSLPEQRKIAECLTALDDVIHTAQEELAAWKELKKGLLQQMFV